MRRGGGGQRHPIPAAAPAYRNGSQPRRAFKARGEGGRSGGDGGPLAVDDLDLLGADPDQLAEAALHHVQLRHGAGQPFAYLGDRVLLAAGASLLPPPASTATGAAPQHCHHRRRHRQPLLSESFWNRLPQDAPPHPFAVADRMYRAMAAGGGAQMVVVAGVSGAGKSAVTRQLLAHWAGLHGGGGSGGGGGGNYDRGAGGSAPPLRLSPGARLQLAAGLLDQFTGAKTSRTRDSSRCGRVFSAAFDHARGGRLAGGKLEVLPLDRARVLGPPPADRSYHIFYQLCFGASLQERERLQLQSVKAYRLLNRSSCFVAGTRDEDDYRRTLAGMRQLGFGAAERRAVVQTVAAVLHAGNLEFTQNSQDGGATTASGSAASRGALAALAAALHVPADELEAVLTTRELSTRGGGGGGGGGGAGQQAVSCRVALSCETAKISRDTVLQLLYSALVEWFVDRLNLATDKCRPLGLAAAATLGVYECHGFERPVSSKALSFCCAPTVFLAKTVPFLAVCLSQERAGFGTLLANYAFERSAALFAACGAAAQLHSSSITWREAAAAAGDGPAAPPPLSGAAWQAVKQAGGGPTAALAAEVVRLIDGRPGACCGAVLRL
eukprot:SAG22_NODE_177_length_16160_cov_41.299296_11_plen_610_part_00